MSETLTTKILIDRAQGGDRAARNDLCARYQDRVLAAARLRMGAKLRQKVQSWDIVQEVLMGAFCDLKSRDFTTEGALMRFLNVLVQNRLRDEARRQRAGRRDASREIPLGGRSPSDEHPLIDLGDPRAPTPSRLLMMREELQQTERAMDRLPPVQRKLLVAVLIEEKTYVELAQEGRFGETPDAVRMKFNRARARLAFIYHQLGGEV